MNRFFLFSGLLLLVLLSDVHSVFGQCTWNGTVNNDWNTGGNWSCGTAPNPASDLVINGFNTIMTNSAGLGVVTVHSLTITNSQIELGNNFTGITVNSTNTATVPLYTFKMTSSKITPQNQSFTSVLITGAPPVLITNSTLGKTTGALKYPVTITNTNTVGNDGSNQNIIVSGTYPSLPTFDGAFTCSANCFKFTSVVFNGSASIVKNSSSPEVTSLNNAGNTFNSTATLTNNSTTTSPTNKGDVSWGNGDSFASATAQVNLSNTSSANFYIASATGTGTTATATFNGLVTSTNSGTGKLIFADLTTNTVNFNGGSALPLKDIWFNNTSSTSAGQIQIGNAGAVAFKYSSVFIGSTGSGITYIGYTASSPNSGSTPRISMEATSNFSTVTSGTTPVFTSGELHIDRFDLATSSSYPVSTLNFNTSAAINLKMGVRTYRDITINAFRIIGIGGTYGNTAIPYNTTIFNLVTGASAQQTDTYSFINPLYPLADLLTFNGNVSFVNAASATWTIGGNGSSTVANHIINFNSPSSSVRSAFLIQTNSNGDITFGYNPCTINISNSNFKIKRNTTSASIYVGFKSNINVTSGDLSNSNLRTDIVIEESGDVSTYNFSIAFGSPNITHGLFSFNGVMNTTGFVGGNLSFGRFTANSDINITAGASPHSTTLITISEFSIFNKNTYFKAPNIKSTGGVFGASPLTAIPYTPSSYTWTSTIWRTAGSAATNPNYFTGNPVFNGSVSIYNESSEAFVFGNTVTDVFIFNSHVALYRYAAGDVRTSGLGLSNYKGNYNYTGSPDATAMLGRSVFNGLVDQSLSCNSLSQSLRFNILEINKAAPISPGLLNDVVLGSVIAVGGTSAQLKLIAGNIRTTSTNLLTIEDGGVITNASANSFVDGPLKKIGLIPSATDFTFQIGKSVINGSTVNKIFMPVSVTVPVSPFSTYTAEFFNQNQPLSNTLGSISDVQRCQYWTISHTGPNESIAVTLPWNNASGQSCYTVNPSVVCVAQQQLGFWQNVGSHPTGSAQGVVKSDILTNQLSSSYIYLCLGYLNALVIDSKATNLAPYSISGGCETLPDTYYSSLGGTLSGDKTILSNSVNTVGGYLVIHPNFSSSIDISIRAAVGGNNEPLIVKVTTNATSIPVVNTVKTDEGNGAGFNDMSPNFYSKSTNQLVFYKQKPDDVLNQLSISLPDGITFEVNKYTTNTGTIPFQISGVPNGVTSATLTVYYNSGSTSTMVTQNNTTWNWNGIGTTGTYNGLICPEGLYTYDLVIVASAQSYTYKGQMILKYK